VVLLVLVTAAPALAAWEAASAGATGVTAAETLPAGAAPTALSRSGRNVDVTWPQVAFRGQLLGTYPQGGYSLDRNGAPAGGTCPATLTPGSLSSSTCRESGLAPGTYAYSVTPQLSGWRGAPSSTMSITVPAPSLTFSPTALTGPGGTLQGTLDAFLDGAALTYRLGNALTGAVLAGSRTTFPTPPSTDRTTSVPVGCGPVPGSSHTVHATSGLEQAAGTFTFDFSTVLCPSALTSTPGLTARRAEAADTLAITFSRAVNPATICSSLTAPGVTPGSLVATVVDGGSANDTLTVTAPAPTTAAEQACGSKAGVSVCLPLVSCLLAEAGTVNLGTFDLGSRDYATGGNVVFGTGTTLALDATGTVLTLTLGTRSGATNGTAAVASIATFTPAPAIRSSVGALAPSGYQRSGAALW
jgi:hypothetical protein